MRNQQHNPQYEPTAEALAPLKAGILKLAEYLQWPAIGLIDMTPRLSLAERANSWQSQLLTVGEPFQLVRLLDAIVQQIDHQAAAGFQTGDTQAGTQQQPSI